MPTRRMRSPATTPSTRSSNRDVTATSLSPGGVSLWSVDLPAGFTPSSSANDQFFYPVAGAAEAFDHRLLVSGRAAGGKPALAVVTDLSFTQPVLTQQDITSGADVAGSVGPFEMPDGTKTVVLTRGNPSDPFDGGTVELAVERKDGWHIEQVIELPAVIAPVEVGDLTGDGISEIVVTVPAPTGAKSWDTLYRLDPAGPTLIDIPFATDELELGPDQALTSLVITSVTRDHVATKLFRCEPSCAEDPGLDVDWVLDRTGTWSLHPTQQVPPSTPPAQTVCIRSNIDFSSLRSAPSLSADLLAKIPPGSCDVILVDPVPVQGNGFGWYHVQWNGIDGWTAVSNTA